MIHDEEYDSFEPARLGGPPAYDANKAFRNRSMTVDSQVSVAESRFGGFDLVDDDGHNKVRKSAKFSKTWVLGRRDQLTSQ